MNSVHKKLFLFLLILTVVSVCFFTMLGYEPYRIEETWASFRSCLLSGELLQAAEFLDSQGLAQQYLSSWRTLFSGEAWSIGDLTGPRFALWPISERRASFALTLADGRKERFEVLFRRVGDAWRIAELPELYAHPAALLYPEEDRMVLLLGDLRFENVELPRQDMPLLGLAICASERLIFWQSAPIASEERVISVSDGRLMGENGSFALMSEIALYQAKGEGYRLLRNFSPGMTDLSLCLWQDAVVGGLLDSAWRPETIRVLLHGADLTQHVQQKVTLLNAVSARYRSLNGTWLPVTSASLQIVWEDKELVLRDASNRELWRGTDTLQLDVGGGIMQLYLGDTTSRSVRGSVELRIMEQEQGFALINELPLEQYLRGVVGNEMPPEFGAEALKIQAIVARGYALQAILQPTNWARYAAHLDDSTASQVYLLNAAESAEVDAAVWATEDETLFYQDRPVQAYFFSTSGGFSAAAEEVWPPSAAALGQRVPYLAAMAQGYGLPLQREEQAILEFYQRGDWQVPDRESPWFRWQIRLSYEQLNRLMSRNLALLSERGGELLQQREADGSFTVLKQAVSEDWLGAISELRAVWRGENGQLLCLEIVGERSTCRVSTEFLIRSLWQPVEGIRPIYRINDGSERTLNLLPSAFVAWTASAEGITFYGGGYGHGVGLSQYGARGLLQSGWSLTRVLQHYYPGTVLQSWREWY